MGTAPKKTAAAPSALFRRKYEMKKGFLNSVCAVTIAFAAFAAASYSQEKKESASAHKIAR